MSRGVRRYALLGVEQVEGVQSHGALAWFVSAFLTQLKLLVRLWILPSLLLIELMPYM